MIFNCFCCCVGWLMKAYTYTYRYIHVRYSRLYLKQRPHSSFRTLDFLRLFSLLALCLFILATFRNNPAVHYLCIISPSVVTFWLDQVFALVCFKLCFVPIYDHPIKNAPSYLLNSLIAFLPNHHIWKRAESNPSLQDACKLRVAA